MEFSITDFFSKFDQIRSFVRVWSHLLKKSLLENLIFLKWFQICDGYFNSFQGNIYRLGKWRYSPGLTVKLIIKIKRNSPQKRMINSKNSLIFSTKQYSLWKSIEWKYLRSNTMVLDQFVSVTITDQKTVQNYATADYFSGKNSKMLSKW